MVETYLLEIIQNQTRFNFFSDEKLSENDLISIAEAGRCSPTELYRDKRMFTIVQKQELIDNLVAELGSALNIENYASFNPAALLIVSVPIDSPYSLFEVGSISQHILFAANALGIGAVWSGKIPCLSDRPAVRKLFTELEIPAEHYSLNIMALGIPSKKVEIEKSSEEINII